MIEIYQIFFQLFLLIFLTSFPVNKYLFSGNTVIKNLNFFDTICINSLFLMFLLLLFSFFKFNLVNIFYFILSIYSILLIRVFLNRKKKIFFKNLPLIIFFLFSLICIFFNTSYQFELGWDGFGWKEKANFFYNGGYLFNINEFTVTYRDYPHLGTYIWAFFWKNSFLDYEYVGRLFYNYLYITSIFALISNFKNISDKKKIFIFILVFFCTFDTGLGGYQDYLIFSILTIFAATLVNDYFHRTKYIIYIVFLLSSILLPWIKAEGFFYSIFLIIIFLIYDSKFKKNKNYFLKYSFLILILFSLLIRVGINNLILDADNLFRNNLIDFINSSLDLNLVFTKVYYIFYYTINSMFKYPLWLFNLLGLFLSICFFKKIKILSIFFVFFILNFSFIFVIYFTSSANIIWYLSTTLDRLLLQTSGFYFSIFPLLNKFNNKIL